MIQLDNFKIIYKILRILEHSMDAEEFDSKCISHEALGISEARWCRIMSLLVNEGYITGAQTWTSFECGYPRVALTRPEITLKGLEYLEENTLMRKAANLAKGIKDTVPGL